MLLYRLPREGWRDAVNVPLQDALRAIRLLRANAAHFAGAAAVGVVMLALSFSIVLTLNLIQSQVQARR